MPDVYSSTFVLLLAFRSFSQYFTAYTAASSFSFEYEDFSHASKAFWKQVGMFKAISGRRLGWREAG